jgi:hypothetical protein
MVAMLLFYAFLRNNVLIVAPTMTRLVMRLMAMTVGEEAVIKGR